MATIPNFPQHLLEEHAQWHSGMNMDIRAGDGLEFLRFHRNFLRKALQWYDTQGLNPEDVAAWTAIPQEIKMHPAWSAELQEAEDRIVGDLASFASSDAFGAFLLGSSLHDAVHALGADMFGDPDFRFATLSPRSTLFYHWHRLIDRWWSDLQRSRKRTGARRRKKPSKRSKGTKRSS